MNEVLIHSLPVQFLLLMLGLDHMEEEEEGYILEDTIEWGYLSHYSLEYIYVHAYTCFM